MPNKFGCEPYHLTIDCHALRTRWYPTDEKAAKVGARWARWVDKHIWLNPGGVGARLKERHGHLPWAVYRDTVKDGALQMYVTPCTLVVSG